MKPLNGFKKKNKCPYCGDEFKGAIDPIDNTKPPIIGALLICVVCNKVSQFNEKFKLVKIPMNKISKETKNDIKIYLKELKRVKREYKKQQAKGINNEN
jgi:hypothetical protein